MTPPKHPAVPKRIRTAFGPTPISQFPRHPQRVAQALHDLAESNPTPSEYDARKAEILRRPA